MQHVESDFPGNDLTIDIVRTKDTGTLHCEIDFDDDQSECIVLERYWDSEALIEHAAHIGDLMEAMVATGSVSGEPPSTTPHADAEVP